MFQRVNDKKLDRVPRENRCQRDVKMKSSGQSGEDNEDRGKYYILTPDFYIGEVITVDRSDGYKFDNDHKQSHELKYPDLYQPFSTLPF